MSQMDRSGTEDLGLVARLMYGYLLSNTRVLSASESSYVLIASLIPQDVRPFLFHNQGIGINMMQVNAQLKGHLVGATHHGGVSIEDVRAVRDVVIDICEAAGMRVLNDDRVGAWGWKEPVARI